MTAIDEKCTSYEVQFKNIDYIVHICVDQQNDLEKIYIEIEEKQSAERWKGVFDATCKRSFYTPIGTKGIHKKEVKNLKNPVISTKVKEGDIEDLTRKTGNFKQFSIFVSMFETALSRASDSVSLELFTYADLEQLRNRKSMSSTNASLLKQNSQQQQQQQSNKRYLILTYNVEFDRIHYPLQLNYHGKPDPVVLQEVIRKLKNELKLYRTQPNNMDAKRNEYIKLQRDYERVLKEKESLDLELFECKREIKSHMSDTNETMQKEIKVLKQMIKSIEEDGLKEKTNYQKQMHKKTKELNQLVEEIEEVRASERNLKHQLKSLQTELAVYRRNRVFSTTNGTPANTSTRMRSRDSSRENSLTRTMTNHRLTPTLSQQQQRVSNTYNRNDYRSNSRESLTAPRSTLKHQQLSHRSSSRERGNGADLISQVANGLRSRSNSYDRSSQIINRRQSHQSRSPSIRSTGSNGSEHRRSAKFNPTEYVKNKNRKLEENELKRQRSLHKNINNGSNRHSRREGSNGKLARTPSVSSINSGLDSDIESINSYDTRQSGRKVNDKWSANVEPVPPSKLLTSSSTPNNTMSNKQQKYNKSKQSLKNRFIENNHVEAYAEDDENDSFIYDREKEIKEIDARLKSLQLFMKNNMP